MPALCRWAGDPGWHLLRFGGRPPLPQTLPSWEKWGDDHVGLHAEPGDASFAIDYDSHIIGLCSLDNIDAMAQTGEVGIAIGERGHWNKSLGREALGLLLDYAFRLRNLRRVLLSTTADNERALRCYRACGFQEEGRLRAHLWSGGAYVDSVYLGLLRSEWNSRTQ